MVKRADEKKGRSGTSLNYHQMSQASSEKTLEYCLVLVMESIRTMKHYRKAKKLTSK